MAENKECILYLIAIDDEYYEDDTKLTAKSVHGCNPNR